MTRRRLAFVALAALLVLVAAGAWFGPSLANPEHWRGTIAVLAGRALGGSRVRITGPIRLALLPEPELSAEDVAIAGRGGASLTARALRLHLALLPLLGGRLKAQALTLAGADWHLPWPETLRPAALQPPRWLGEVEADVEDGRITIGRLAITGIDAQAATDRLTGTLTASGEGRIAGRRWHFALRLSRPGADGAAALDLALDGAGALAGTAARFSGQMAADGTLAGALRGHGLDLGALVPAPHEAWRGSGRLGVAKGLAVGDQLVLQLGDAPARGAIALRLAGTPRLDLALGIGRIDLSTWLAVLGQASVRMPLPTGMDLSAEAASLGGADLRRLRVGLDLTPKGLALRDASAELPGGAALRLHGAMLNGGFQGAAVLDAPDFRRTLDWFAPLAGLPPGLPAPRVVQLTAAVAVAAGRIALGDIGGTADGVRVGGSLTVQPGAPPGARPMADAQLSFGALELGGLDAAAADALRRTAAAIDLSLRLRAGTASWAGVRAEDVALDAKSDAAGITLQRLALRLDGAAVTASGRLGADGGTDARVDLATPNAAGLAALLPADWRVPGLLQGAAHATFAVNGKPAALATHLHLELGAVRLDASPTIDLPAGTGIGPVALAAPDATGLLAALGVPKPAWLGAGPLAVQGTASAAARRITVDDLDLAAGAMRAGGHLTLSWTGKGPHVSGGVHAASLPLPWPSLRNTRPLGLFAVLAGYPTWSGALTIAAARVLDGDATVLRDASGTLALDRGTLRLDALAADLAGGQLEGDLTLQAAQTPPHLAARLHLTGARIAAPLLGLPLDLAAAEQMDGGLDATASGYSPAALLATLAGRVEADAKGGTVTGFDLPALHAALGGHPARARSAAAKALAGGSSPFTTLHLAGVLDHGSLTLEQGEMTAPDGTATLAGTAALGPGALDLRLSLHPAGEGAPDVGLLLSGSQTAPQRVRELAGLAAWLAARR